jgi:hypothetical protein
VMAEPKKRKLLARKVPTKFKGTGLEFWHRTGAIGLNDRLVVYEGDIPVIGPDQMNRRRRILLGRGMIARWQKFIDAEG